MAEIVGRIDAQVLAQRQESARVQSEVGKVRALHEQRRERLKQQRRDEARVRRGKFNSIKMRSK